MLQAVSGQKRDAALGDGPDHDRCRWITVRRRDGMLGRIGEERIETGPAENADLRARGHYDACDPAPPPESFFDGALDSFFSAGFDSDFSDEPPSLSLDDGLRAFRERLSVE
jgi:hypothetical protein